jgi:broad-specificity NMP kinase
VEQAHGQDDRTTKKYQQLIDELEPLASAGGLILDWHSCEPWPERWVDLVVVLRCDHTKLWERLEKRYVELFCGSIQSNDAT